MADSCLDSSRTLLASTRTPVVMTAGKEPNSQTAARPHPPMACPPTPTTTSGPLQTALQSARNTPPAPHNASAPTAAKSATSKRTRSTAALLLIYIPHLPQGNRQYSSKHSPTSHSRPSSLGQSQRRVSASQMIAHLGWLNLPVATDSEGVYPTTPPTLKQIILYTQPKLTSPHQTLPPPQRHDETRRERQAERFRRHRQSRWHLSGSIDTGDGWCRVPGCCCCAACPAEWWWLVF